MKFSVTGQEEGDLLIQVTVAWAGLTVLINGRHNRWHKADLDHVINWLPSILLEIELN